MERLRQLLQGSGGLGIGSGIQNGDLAQIDNSETVYISSLALLKMLKHGNN